MQLCAMACKGAAPQCVACAAEMLKPFMLRKPCHTARVQRLSTSVMAHHTTPQQVNPELFISIPLNPACFAPTHSSLRVSATLGPAPHLVTQAAAPSPGHTPCMNCIDLASLSCILPGTSVIFCSTGVDSTSCAFQCTSI